MWHKGETSVLQGGTWEKEEEGITDHKKLKRESRPLTFFSLQRKKSPGGKNQQERPGERVAGSKEEKTPHLQNGRPKLPPQYLPMKTKGSKAAW